MTKEEEKSIIDRIKAGETPLFDKLVDYHSPKILSVITGVVGIKEDAEEVAQDVFVKAFFSLDKFRGDCAFSTWLFRIAYNMSISAIRKRRNNLIPLEMVSNFRQISEQSSENESDEIIRLNEKRVLEIINKLDSGDRFLLLLFYNQEKSIKDISDITGLSEANIKTKLHRIKKRVRVMLGDKMEVCYG